MMKRNILILLLAITTSVFVFSCKSNSGDGIKTDNASKTDSLSMTHSPDAEITMTINPEAFSTVPETIKMTIVNNSEETAEYGAYYAIEEYQNDNWVRLPLNDELAFIDILYIQPGGETREYDISLYPDMANYQKGKYRIRKSINLGNNTLDISALFTVE